MSGDFPWRLEASEVWKLMKDGFSASEIAHIAGVTLPVALAMMNEAVPRPSAKPVLRLPHAA